MLAFTGWIYTFFTKNCHSRLSSAFLLLLLLLHPHTPILPRSLHTILKATGATELPLIDLLGCFGFLCTWTSHCTTPFLFNEGNESYIYFILWFPTPHKQPKKNLINLHLNVNLSCTIWKTKHFIESKRHLAACMLWFHLPHQSPLFPQLPGLLIPGN